MSRRAAACLSISFALFALILSPRPAAAVGSAGDMYITGDVSNTVRVYTPLTANFLGNFTSTTNSPLGIHFGTSNGRVLVGGFSGLAEYDVATGAFIKNYGPAQWEWSAVYASNGNVFLAASYANQLIEYDSVTGAFVQVKQTFAGQPTDMRYGPNGNLYVCQYFPPMVFELDPVTCAIISGWSLPVGGRTNDVEFLNGEILVTALGTNQVYRFDSTPAHTLLGQFSGTGWGNTHGLAVSPHDGYLYVVDGVSAQVHKFDPLTFVELDAAVLTPPPGDKVVDIAFRPADGPTPAATSTWGRLKALYR